MSWCSESGDCELDFDCLNYNICADILDYEEDEEYADDA